MGKIKLVKNLENKTLKELVEEELKEKPKYTWKDLKLTKNKELTNKYIVWYLDSLLLRIVDSYFTDVNPEINAFLYNIEHLEKKGHNIDEWLIKYNIVMNRRASVKGNYL